MKFTHILFSPYILHILQKKERWLVSAFFFCVGDFVENMGFCNAGVRFSVLLIKVLRNLLKVIKIEPLLSFLGYKMYNGCNLTFI